jgi:hypothetical protein
MKITEVTVEVVSEPKAHAVRDAIQLLDRNGHTRLRIDGCYLLPPAPGLSSWND